MSATNPDKRGTAALVALSGGVDSSVTLMTATREYDTVRAAYIDVTGKGPNPFAVDVAAHFGLELINCKVPDKFSVEVIEPSLRMLKDGYTPNPCALCNARIKFAILFDKLKPEEILLTGHYAINSSGNIMRGADTAKDQSYFLSLVGDNILKRCKFPLGGMNKTDVRRMAEENSIPFRRDESMDLCFEFPKQEDTPGIIYDMEGCRIGEHDGVHNFTVGQRKGVGSFGSRKYVVSIDSATASVVIGDKCDLLSSGCVTGGLNIIGRLPGNEFSAYVQTRYRRKPVPAQIEIHKDRRMTIEFDTPEEAVAPGQVCAVYLENTLLCGSIIISTTGIPGRRDV